MTKAILKQGAEQNGVVSERPFSAAHRDTDTEMDAVPVETSPPLGTPAGEIEVLRAENIALRDMVEELEKLLEEKLRAENTWTERQKEQEALLEEKSDVIRELHLKLQERPAAAAPREPAAIPREEELLALSEELEHERGQLKDDEEALMAQMREMEVQMSRDRAELARQRNDLQRLHSEILHEIELASRHAALRDRLQPLQRRHQEMLHQKGTEAPREAPPRAGPGPSSTSTPPQEAPTKDSNGLLRRLFG
jgi:myosin heavy subunit